MTTEELLALFKVDVREDDDADQLEDDDIYPYFDGTRRRLFNKVAARLGVRGFEELEEDEAAADSDGKSAALATIPLAIAEVAVDYGGGYITAKRHEGGYEKLDSRRLEASQSRPVWRLRGSVFEIAPASAGTIKYRWVEDPGVFSGLDASDPTIMVELCEEAWAHDAAAYYWETHGNDEVRVNQCLGRSEACLNAVGGGFR